MSKSNKCKLGFYFTRQSIQKLLDENPDAKGIIVSQEIKVRQGSDKQKLNVVEIKATADNSEAKTKSMTTDIDGCPYPPGCGGADTPDDN